MGLLYGAESQLTPSIEVRRETVNIKMHTMNERQTEERKKESERAGQRPNKVSGYLCA